MDKNLETEGLGYAGKRLELENNVNNLSRHWQCEVCRQFLDHVTSYNEHVDASSEEAALTSEKLSLFTGEESFIDELDQKPTHKVTQFSIYCERGHLCFFDTGLLEMGAHLIFSGSIKPLSDDDSSSKNGVPAKNMGPISGWWTSGFDGGPKALVGLSTDFAEYYLMEPSEEYKPFWGAMSEKIRLSKKIIEFLLDSDKIWENPSYADLLHFIHSLKEFPHGEESLLKHAQFICDRVVNLEIAGDMIRPLISTACMRSLVKLGGVVFNDRKHIRKRETKRLNIKSSWTKVATTNLVSYIFDTCFKEQIAKQKDAKGSYIKGCGVCAACLNPECGECEQCKSKKKKHGSTKINHGCERRVCLYKTIEEADFDSDSDNEDVNYKLNTNEHLYRNACATKTSNDVVFPSEPILLLFERKFYNSVLVDGTELNIGDFVILNWKNFRRARPIGKICFIFSDAVSEKQMCHVHLFERATDSILGDIADPNELFVIDHCEEVPLGSIVRQARVEHRRKESNWPINFVLPPPLKDDERSFYFSLRFDRESSRFEDFIQEPEDETSYNNCDSCRRFYNRMQVSSVKYKNDEIIWMDETFAVGTCVFLIPEAHDFKIKDSGKKEKTRNAPNRELYSEYYRKVEESIKGSNQDTSDTFIIARIEEIDFNRKRETKLKVRIFYRPQHIDSRYLPEKLYEKDLNYVYWTEIIIETPLDNVLGKCYVFYAKNSSNLSKWITGGPHRFYFEQCYNIESTLFEDVPYEATKMGCSKITSEGESNLDDSETLDAPPDWPKVSALLKTMDVFAGCGGLTEGLHQAGVSETKWAIEKEKAPAEAFRLNNPGCAVFIDDCNNLLKLALNDNEEAEKRGFPKRGEVQMLVGGPPCQGFSGLNRFNDRQYSVFKNSLIVSLLGYCDYFRPKYFILENVRNFVSFKKNMVLKLTLKCLLALGYQVTFGILQAGHYGVPQTRRRLFIIAAATGYVLPRFPEPSHVFNKRGCQLSFVVGQARFGNGNKWIESAPYRTITVRDAISDLPRIKNGCNQIEMKNDCQPQTHFQRLMRESDASNVVYDHIGKEMCPLVQARIRHVPCSPGSDWRDLPNTVVRLNDGTYTQELKYLYRTRRQKAKDQPRGVCQCASGLPCDPLNKQMNTLIPWCLPHTGDRHNNWSGLYGRLDWNGYFGTTLTIPEPMGKQGRVLHPSQTRVVSVRECARSQGFPDKFKFYGSILNKYRQIGNAVPPPVAAAIGREIAKATTCKNS